MPGALAFPTSIGDPEEKPTLTRVSRDRRGCSITGLGSDIISPPLRFMADKIMPLSDAVEGYDLFDKMKAQKVIFTVGE